MGKQEIEVFLTSLAVVRNVSASTQTQALSALLFLYKEVLGMDFPWLTEVTHAKPSVRLPTILNREEVRLSARLCAHLAAVKAQHEADLALNKGEVWLPDWR